MHPSGGRVRKLDLDLLKRYLNDALTQQAQL